MQDHFKVLPTDERFKQLTSEQVELMWAHYLMDNPKLADLAEVFRDPGYEAAEKDMLVDQRALEAKAEPVLAPVEVDVVPV